MNTGLLPLPVPAPLSKLAALPIFQYHVPNEMTINFNMLGFFLEHLITRNVDSCLSQYILMVPDIMKIISCKRDVTHIISQDVWTIALYSGSALDWATTFCFLLLHVTKYQEMYNSRKSIFHHHGFQPNQHQKHHYAASMMKLPSITFPWSYCCLHSHHHGPSLMALLSLQYLPPWLLAFS